MQLKVFMQNSFDPVFPMEIFFLIAEQSDAHSLARLLQTNKDMQAIANNDRLWRKLFPAVKYEGSNFKDFLNVHSVQSLEELAEKIDFYFNEVQPGQGAQVSVLFPFNNNCWFEAMLFSTAILLEDKPILDEQKRQIVVKKLPQNNTSHFDINLDGTNWNGQLNGELPFNDFMMQSAKKIKCEGVLPESNSQNAIAQMHVAKTIDLMKIHAELLETEDVDAIFSDPNIIF